MDKKTKLKQKIDGILTDYVLGKIPKSALAAAKDTATRLATGRVGNAAADNVDYYYLKGGKSLQLLKNEQGGGDWDFQLKPTASVFADWETADGELKTLHDGLIFMLWDIAEDNLSFANMDRDEADDLKSIIADDQDQQDALHQEIADAFFEVAGVKPGNITIKTGSEADEPNTYVVGPALLTKTERQMLTDADFNKKGEGRMDLDDDQSSVDPGIIAMPNDPMSYHNQAEPRVYVNCSISNFILYRLAIFYKINFDGQHVPDELNDLGFKSEVVDISIPRKGTPEALSHLEEVTTVRELPWDPADPNSSTVNVPGWRYHMLENTNIFCEIKMGVSAAPHKVDKRRQRGGIAINQLRSKQDNDAGISLSDILTSNAVYEWSPNVVNEALQSYIPLFKAEIAQVDGGYGTDYVNQVIDTQFAELLKEGRITQKDDLGQAQEVGTVLACLPSELVVFPDCADMLGVLGKLLTSKKTPKVRLNMIMSAASALSWNNKNFKNEKTKLIYPQATALFKVNEDAFADVLRFNGKKENISFGDLTLKSVALEESNNTDSLVLTVVKSKGPGPHGPAATTIIVQPDPDEDWANDATLTKVTNSAEKLVPESDLPTLELYRDKTDDTVEALLDLVSHTSIASIRYPLAEAARNLKML